MWYENTTHFVIFSYILQNLETITQNVTIIFIRGDGELALQRKKKYNKKGPWTSMEKLVLGALALPLSTNLISFPKISF